MYLNYIIAQKNNQTICTVKLIHRIDTMIAKIRLKWKSAIELTVHQDKNYKGFFFAEVRNRKITDNSIYYTCSFASLFLLLHNFNNSIYVGNFAKRNMDGAFFFCHPELCKVNLFLTGKEFFQRKFSIEK